MDAVSQRHNIIIPGAHDDACVRPRFSMQADKVAPIKCQHRSTLCGCKRNDGSICDTLVRLAGLIGGADVVAELTQSLDYRITKILVRIQHGHRLYFRGILDSLLNLLAMRGIIVPHGF